MAAEGASSRTTSGIGHDGTHAVYCWLCRNPVGRTTDSITRVLCAVCEAAENGKPMTEDALRAYYASRQQLSATSMLVMDETPPVRIPGKKRFSLAAVGENLSVALGFLRRKPEETGAAAALAKSKRRGRLLEGLETELPDMETLDETLRKQRDGG